MLARVECDVIESRKCIVRQGIYKHIRVTQKYWVLRKSGLETFSKFGQSLLLLLPGLFLFKLVFDEDRFHLLASFFPLYLWGSHILRAGCVTNQHSRTFVNNLLYAFIDWLSWFNLCVYVQCVRCIHQTLLFTDKFKLNFKWINVMRSAAATGMQSANTTQHSTAHIQCID